jgi:transposase
MAKVNLSKEEIEMLLKGLANLVTIKHRYREVKMMNLDIDMIRDILHKLENPFQSRYNEIIRNSEDKQPRVGNCECCND